MRKEGRTLTGLIVPAHAAENEVVETMAGLIVPVSALKGAEQSVKIGDRSALGQISKIALEQRAVRNYNRQQRRRHQAKRARASRKLHHK